LSLVLIACTPQAAPALPTEMPQPTAPPTDAPTEPPPPTPTEAPPPTPTEEPGPEPLTFTDGLGREITLDGPALQVVSLAPSNTEILFAIGAGEQVVGRDEFTNYPPEATNLPSVGGSFGDYNLETIVDLDPDLVLAAEINPPELVESLEELGLTVYWLPNPTELAGMYENLITVGQLTCRESEAEALVADLQRRVAAIEEQVAAAETTPTVFYELDGSDPSAPWTSGSGTFIDLLIEMAGGENAAAGLESAYAQISVEELVAQNPDVILLGDAAYGTTPEIVAARAGWEAIDAVQNDRVHPFNDDLASRPGPRLVDGLEEMVALLHPELVE
jgi:iron complex transport system substrate-binding protein